MPPKNDMLPIDVAPESTDGGTITYANEVIAIISGIAASEIEGIAGMVTSGGFGDIIGKNRNITRGVKVEVGTQEVSVDLYALVEYGQPIQKVASQVQENVRKSIEAMTGLKVVKVDVHIQGVSFEKEKREVQSNLESANVPNLMGGTKKKGGKAAEKKAAAEEEKQAAEKAKEQAAADQAKEQAAAELAQAEEPAKSDAAAAPEQQEAAQAAPEGEPLKDKADAAGDQTPTPEEKAEPAAKKAPAKPARKPRKA